MIAVKETIELDSIDMATALEIRIIREDSYMEGRYVLTNWTTQFLRGGNVVTESTTSDLQRKPNSLEVATYYN